MKFSDKSNNSFAFCGLLASLFSLLEKAKKQLFKSNKRNIYLIVALKTGCNFQNKFKAFIVLKFIQVL
jgi:hypothetical protein